MDDLNCPLGLESTGNGNYLDMEDDEWQLRRSLWISDMSV